MQRIFVARPICHQRHPEFADVAIKSHLQILTGMPRFRDCGADALLYEGLTTWQKASKGAYKSARSNGWLEESSAHMARPSKPKAR
jgi:hypothetical protein